MNSRWLIRTVGLSEYHKIKHNYISCSGTTLGNYNEILKYTKTMDKNIDLYPYKKPLRHFLTFKKVRGFDQGIHNFIVHNKIIKKAKLHKNNYSNIATISYMKKYKFNNNKMLINEKNRIYSLVHQYDRAKNKTGKQIFDLSNFNE